MKKDLTGLLFGRLKVLNLKYYKNYKGYWNCICECGNFTTVVTHQLMSGKTKSCGCLNKEIVGNLFKTHGMRNHPIYRVWANMIGRCENKNNTAYERYGGRGIIVCESWHVFENFFRDMGNPPLGMTLNRINNDGNYEHNNCNWVTRKMQARNRKSNKMLTFDNKTCLVVEWAEMLNIPERILYKRLYRGWSVERTLTTPSKR